MDVCVRDQPDLIAVSDGVGHLSACWLPATAVGVGEGADAARQRYVASRRGSAVLHLRGVMSAGAGGAAHG
jgi:hypothetical protein